MLTFSNPRRSATFDDWPLGRDKRGPCAFAVEPHPKRGERVSRTTYGKPKFTTYAERFVIVDGSDGKTYLLAYSSRYGESVRVVSSDLEHDAPPDGRSSAYFRPDDPEFAGLKAIIDNRA